MRLEAVAALCLVCACDTDTFVGADGGQDVVTPPADSGAEASEASVGRCDPLKPFANPTKVPSLNGAADQGGVWLSPDEHYAFVVANEVAVYSRADDTSPFAFQQTLALGSPITSVWLTDDQLTIYYGLTGSLWTASRASLATPFTNPVSLTSLNVVGATAEYVITLTNNQQQVFFDAVKTGTSQIYSSQYAGSTFTTPILFTGTMPTADEGTPVLSGGGHALYFASNRAGGQGARDIWVARRTSSGGVFTAPQIVTELNSTDNDWPAWVSADDCVIYFTRGPVGGRSIYFARRSP